MHVGPLVLPHAGQFDAGGAAVVGAAVGAAVVVVVVVVDDAGLSQRFMLGLHTSPGAQHSPMLEP